MILKCDTHHSATLTYPNSVVCAEYEPATLLYLYSGCAYLIAFAITGSYQRLPAENASGGAGLNHMAAHDIS
jgi:hypothetical protein